MKFIVSILVTAVLAFALGLYLPWWSLTISCFIIAFLIPQKPGWAFVSAFAAMFLTWGIMALVISGNNDHILAHRVSELIIKSDSPGVLILLTALLGALPAGVAGLSGSLLRSIVFRHQ